jgi:hypothetical protein
MSPDSVGQIAGGRRLRFSDWNPPVKAWVWEWVDRIVPGPLGMLLLQASAWHGCFGCSSCSRAIG